MAQRIPEIAPYFDLHQHTDGPGDLRPTAMQIIQDQNLFGQLGHLNILVTGGNSGLGRETVRALHATGAQLVIAVAPGVDGETAAREIEESNKSDSLLAQRSILFQPIKVVSIDLASLSHVKAAAAEVIKITGGRLNILICNTGVMKPNIQQTKDCLEPHFGINYLGHFLLFNELAGALAQGNASTTSFASRVVVLSSLGHRVANVDTSKLPPNTENEPECRVQNFYSESKTELLWIANEIERRFGAEGIHGIAVNPGSIVTPLTAHIGWDTMRQGLGKDVEEFDRLTKNLEQGAATTTWAAVGMELENKGAIYLDNVQIAKPAVEGTPDFTHGYAPWAYDNAKARQLWDISVNLLKGKGF